MDYIVIQEERLQIAPEAQKFGACFDEAARNGIPQERAELCVDYRLKCRLCPLQAGQSK